jgi:hypothetical protein
MATPGHDALHTIVFVAIHKSQEYTSASFAQCTYELHSSCVYGGEGDVSRNRIATMSVDRRSVNWNA